MNNRATSLSRDRWATSPSRTWSAWPSSSWPQIEGTLPTVNPEPVDPPHASAETEVTQEHDSDASDKNHPGANTEPEEQAEQEDDQQSDPDFHPLALQDEGDNQVKRSNRTRKPPGKHREYVAQ